VGLVVVGLELVERGDELVHLWSGGWEWGWELVEKRKGEKKEEARSQRRRKEKKKIAFLRA
jgi:hypothetical protein